MSATYSWLMAGDPAIRWQTMRDLGAEEPKIWQAERERVATAGWGKQFLDYTDPDGDWPDGRWTGTIWSLLQLVEMGISPDFPEAKAAAFRFMERNLTLERVSDRNWLMNRMDLCHLGFWLRIGSYFGFDPLRLRALAEPVVEAQMADGGWNCRIRTNPTTHHSSFHTTLNVLEGLREANGSGFLPDAEFRAVEHRAVEFMLIHRLYRSDRTGEIIHPRFTELSYPHHWHYTVLRGLDYLRRCPEIHDERLEDPIRLLESRRSEVGRWPVEKRIPGTALFNFEKAGADSRWNTLRALRILANFR